MNTALLTFQIPKAARATPKAFFFLSEIHLPKPETTFSATTPCGAKAEEKQESSEALDGPEAIGAAKAFRHLA